MAIIDYSLPVATRTRARIDKAYWDYIKKNKKHGVRDSALRKVAAKRMIDRFKLKPRCTLDFESVSVSDHGVPSMGEEDGDSVDSCPGESAGLKNGKKSKLGFGKTENVDPIDVEDSDDDIVFSGEEGEGGGFGCLNLQKSEGAGEDANEHASEDESEADGEDGSQYASDGSYEMETLSSEEESFYSDGEDCKPEKPPISGLEKLNSCGGDVEVKKGQNNDESEVRKGSGKLGKGQSVEVGVKGKRKLGFDILLDTHNDIDSNKDDAVNSGQKFNCVAHQTCSSSSSGCGKKRTKPGASSQPLCVDEDDLGSSFWHDDGSDDVDETCFSGQRTKNNKKKTRSDDKRNDDKGETYLGSLKIGSDRGKAKSDKWNDVQNVCKKNEGDLGNFADRKCTQATKDLDHFENLLDSFYDEEEVPLEGLSSFGDEAPKDERNPSEATKNTLPLKFEFKMGQSSSPEKSDSDSELDGFWAKGDFAPKSPEIGSADSKVEGLASIGDEVPKDEKNPSVAKKTTLPLKFDFNLKQSSVPKKSEFDIEQDELWANYDFALRSCAMPSTDSNVEGLASFGDEAPKDERNPSVAKNTTLPLKFDFKLGQSSPPEKSESDSELDELWPKSDFSLKTREIGSADSNAEGLASFGDESPKDETNPSVAKKTTLPLKFDFNLKQSSVPEKSEYDREQDELWANYDFALRTGEIGSADSNVVENKDSLPPVNEADTAPCCSQGNHEYILDEEIGTICRFCFIVKQEIKYFMPSFDKYPFGKPSTRGILREEQSTFNEQCPDVKSNVHAHNGEGTVWDLIPGVKSSMYDHQIEGFEFIWKHMAGGIHLENVEKTSSPDGGNGCIISHAPGTGKTRLTIVFLQSYMKLYCKVRPLIIAPRSMLLTWGEELKKWDFGIPFHNLNDHELSGQEDKAATNRMKRESQSSVLDKRKVKLYSWKKEKSILGISYGLFEKLCGENRNKKEKNETSGASKKDEVVRKILLEQPGVVVFDEGHTPRNDKSYMWMTVSQIKTKRRILLSGTPFQNNFLEFSNTICVVRPELGDSIKSAYCGDFSKNRGRKSFADDNTKLATVFRAKITPFVHSYRGSILKDSLPGLRKWLVILQPTPLQESFIRRIQVTRKEPFRYDRLEAEISVHPSIMLKEVLFSDDRDTLKNVQSNPGAGVKAKFVMELVRLSEALNERVLVFSQYIDSLTITKDLLKSQLQWIEGQEILYMDGTCDAKQRQYSMKVFNDPSTKAKVLLASTKACNEGINLVGASRVVFLDVTWNPSVQRQAISRAYRLGQKKLVFIYHLIMARTKEEEKHSCQAEKHRLSELVISGSDRYGDGKKISDTVSEDKILEVMVQHENLKHLFRSIAVLDEDELKASTTSNF